MGGELWCQCFGDPPKLFRPLNVSLPPTPAEVVMAGLPSLPPTGPLAYELGRRMFLKIAAAVTAGASVGPVIGEKALAARRGPRADPGADLTTMPGPGRFPLVAGRAPRPLRCTRSQLSPRVP